MNLGLRVGEWGFGGGRVVRVIGKLGLLLLD